MATGKKLYNAITRGIFHWSDGEGTHDRIEQEGAAIEKALRAVPGVTDVFLAHFPLPRKGSGIYAFVETAASRPDARSLRAAASGADLIQPVVALPRDGDGSPRADILRRIAMNQMTGIEDLAGDDEQLAAIITAIADGRMNFSDRRITRLEQAGDPGANA